MLVVPLVGVIARTAHFGIVPPNFRDKLEKRGTTATLRNGWLR